MNYQLTLPNCIHGKAGVYALSCEQAGKIYVGETRRRRPGGCV